MLTLTSAHSHDVNLSTRLVIQVFHRSQTKKKHRKRNLVGSASVSLNEFLNKHPLPHPRPVDYDVRLSCPPPQRKSPTIAGPRPVGLICGTASESLWSSSPDSSGYSVCDDIVAVPLSSCWFSTIPLAFRANYSIDASG